MGTVGDNIRDARRMRGLTQDDVAAKLCVKRQTYSAYERGVSMPDAETVCILADLFDTTVDALLGRPLADSFETELLAACRGMNAEGRDKVLVQTGLFCCVAYGLAVLCGNSLRAVGSSS